MLKKICLILCLVQSLNANIADYITYVPSDIYNVTSYNADAYGVTVTIEDWYHKTSNTYYCGFEHDWCYPKFYPTLAVMYGKKVEH